MCAAAGEAITVDGTAYTVRVIQLEGTSVTTYSFGEELATGFNRAVIDPRLNVYLRTPNSFTRLMASDLF